MKAVPHRVGQHADALRREIDPAEEDCGACARLTVVTMSAASIARRTMPRRPIQMSVPCACSQ